MTAEPWVSEVDDWVCASGADEDKNESTGNQA
jgi:hypothetical protein